MNEEVKEKWVAALRSGEYEQGKSTLRFEDSYCCLGVLCDIAGKEVSLGQWEEFKDSPGEYRFRHGISDYAYNTGFPPAVLREWAEIDKEQVSYLAFMNDTEQNGFSEIANYIETEL